jgi:hypothetical protein
MVTRTSFGLRCETNLYDLGWSEMTPSKAVDIVGAIHRKLRLARLSSGVGGRRGRDVKSSGCGWNLKTIWDRATLACENKLTMKVPRELEGPHEPQLWEEIGTSHLMVCNPTWKICLCLGLEAFDWWNYIMPSTLWCGFCRAMRWVELKGGVLWRRPGLTLQIRQ